MKKPFFYVGTSFFLLLGVLCGQFITPKTSKAQLELIEPEVLSFEVINLIASSTLSINQAELLIEQKKNLQPLIEEQKRTNYLLSQLLRVQQK